MLTIFYDGTCPLCSKEMDLLRTLDVNSSLNLVELHSQIFREQYTHIHYDDAMRILHAEQDGVLLKGLDVTAAAWKAVDKKPWVQVLRWPIIRWFADLTYLMFAKYRGRISWLLTGKSTCDSGQCYVDQGSKNQGLSHQDSSDQGVSHQNEQSERNGS